MYTSKHNHSCSKGKDDNLGLKKSMLWQVWLQNIQQKSCCLPYHISLLTEACKWRHATKFQKEDLKSQGMLIDNKTVIYEYKAYLKEKISYCIIIYWAATLHLWHHESKVHSSLVLKTVRNGMIRLMMPQPSIECGCLINDPFCLNNQSPVDLYARWSGGGRDNLECTRPGTKL